VLAAVTVIFLELYFSLSGLIMTDSPALALTVLAYSSICLFSFVNLAYVRDFDVVQSNITPIALCIVGLTQLNGFEFSKLGMTLALMADSYFALRYKDYSDEIEYNALELFAQESWTQQAFDKTNNHNLQLGAITMIFAQIFMTLYGTVSGFSYQALFLSFYLARLVQFFFSTVKGIDMIQSNLVCVILAVISLKNLGSTNMSSLQCLLMLGDAYIGALLFVISKNIQVS